MFSSTFIAIIVYLSLSLCAITSTLLLYFLVKEMKRGKLW